MGRGGGGGHGVWGQGGCERRSKVFVKIQTKKKFLGGGGRSEAFVKIKFFFFFFFFLGGGGGGVRVGGGQGGCELISEAFVNI